MIENSRGALEAIRRLTFETGELRRERRNGWHHIGADPESVAEHTQRATTLAFLLSSFAQMTESEFAKIDPCYVATLVNFHDIHEARTGDDDLVQKQYLKIDRATAVRDQIDGLGPMGETIKAMWLEVEEATTPSGKLAKDAELLEMAFTGRELVVLGNKEAQAWIDAVGPRLKTNAGRELFKLLQDADPSEWWKRLLGYRTTNASLGPANAGPTG